MQFSLHIAGAPQQLCCWFSLNSYCARFFCCCFSCWDSHVFTKWSPFHKLQCSTPHVRGTSLSPVNKCSHFDAGPACTVTFLRWDSQSSFRLATHQSNFRAVKVDVVQKISRACRPLSRQTSESLYKKAENELLIFRFYPPTSTSSSSSSQHPPSHLLIPPRYCHAVVKMKVSIGFLVTTAVMQGRNIAIHVFFFFLNLTREGSCSSAVKCHRQTWCAS